MVKFSFYTLSCHCNNFNHWIVLKITYIDFVIYELLDQNSQLIPGLLDEFPNLKEFHARIGGLEKVAAYLSSDKCIKYPFNGPMAQWGEK